MAHRLIGGLLPIVPNGTNTSNQIHTCSIQSPHQVPTHLTTKPPTKPLFVISVHSVVNPLPITHSQSHKRAPHPAQTRAQSECSENVYSSGCASRSKP